MPTAAVRSTRETLTPAERTLRARLGAYESWARTSDPSARTEPARAAFLERFEREVDPDGTLPDEERARRAEAARKAYFTRLALASTRSRKAKKSEREETPAATPAPLIDHRGGTRDVDPA